jgi:hypothetical protein
LWISWSNRRECVIWLPQSFFLIKQLATTFFLWLYIWLPFFFKGQSLVIVYFLLNRQCGESRLFRTLKLSERVCPSAMLQSSKALLGELNPSFKLCPVQNSVPTHNPQVPKFQPALWIPCCTLCWPSYLQATNKDSMILKNSQIGQNFNQKIKSSFKIHMMSVHCAQWTRKAATTKGTWNKTWLQLIMKFLLSRINTISGLHVAPQGNGLFEWEVFKFVLISLQQELNYM